MKIKNLLLLNFLILILVGINFVYAQGKILLLNSSSKKVLHLNPTDGTLVNGNFIDLSTQSAGTIKGIEQVGDKIWITDQTNDKIYIYDLTGAYVNTILPNTQIDNLRGLAVVDNEVWVTLGGSANGAVNNSVRRFDFNGNPLGNYNTVSSPFDVLNLGNGIALVSSFNTDGIEKLNYDGTSAGKLVASGILNGVQQLSLNQDGHVIAAVFSNQASSGNSAGLYIINSSTGAIMNSWPISGGIRGAIQAGNGNYLYTNGTALYSLDPSTGQSTQLTTGGFQFLAKVDDPLLATAETTKNTVSVYPNPTKGELHIQSDTTIKNVNIYSASGQKVMQSSGKDKSKNLNLEQLPKGIYILNIEGENQTQNVKVIKE